MLLPPLSLYIHIPWCIKKCPYCDFNSHKVPDENLPEKTYIDALICDLKQDYALAGNRDIHSIFIGGGTPSLFRSATIQLLLHRIKSEVNLAENVEISLEANPGTFEQEKFSAFREAGVNRLSIGIQSFDNSLLKKLGRIHNSEEALNAVNIARRAGFDNINLDLMFGLPDQSTDNALHDLRTAIHLEPEHLSWYQLTIEPNTIFHSKPPQLPTDEIIWTIQEQGQKLLAQKGFKQYEISAYSQPLKQCQHNINYWQFSDYIGIGAGAHGKITQITPQKDKHPLTIRRYWKLRQPEGYLKAHTKNLVTGQCAFTAGQRFLTSEELPLEFMMNALRLKEGVKRKIFSQYTGLAEQDIPTLIERGISSGLLQADKKRLRASNRGYVFLNDLLALF